MPLHSRLLAALALVAWPVATLAAQSFSGTVLIEQRPADPGTYVQVVVFRADRSFTVCGDTTVGSSGHYKLVVYPKPDCQTPGDRYEFYINGVWAANGSGTATAPGANTSANLSAPMLALKTPNRPGVRLVWFYGTVTDHLNRPAAPGLRIIASPDSTTSPGNSCLGTGVTQDLFWTPKTPGAQPLNVKGFYLIGVEMAAECQDKVVGWLLRGAGGSSQGSITPQYVPLQTPPYGLPSHKNLVLKAN